MSDRAAALLPDARVLHLPELGHLAHEEDPERVAAEIGGFLAAGRRGEAKQTGATIK